MRKPHQIKTREAAIYSAFWIALGLSFTGVIYLGILAFVGVKFMISEWYAIPTGYSLAFIAVVLTGTILLLWRATKKDAAGQPA